MNAPYTPLSAALPEGLFPEGLFGSDSSFLDRVAVLLYQDGGSAVDPRADDDAEQFNVFVRCKVMDEVRIPLAFLPGCELVFGAGNSPETGLVDIEFAATTYPDDPPDLRFRIRTTLLNLAVSRDILTPVSTQLVGDQLEVTELEGNVGIPLPFDLLIEYVDEDWRIDFDVPAGQGTSLALPLCAVGDTGVLLEASGVSLNFDGNGARPATAPADWAGVFLGQVDVYLPQIFSGKLSATDMGLGAGGVYGGLSATFQLAFDEASGSFNGDLAGSLLGFEGGIDSIEISLTQNIPTEFEVGAQLLLPFFEKPVSVVLSVDIAGEVSVRLAANDGLATLEIEGVLTLEVNTFGLGYTEDSLTVSVGGELTPQLAGLDWPSFAVEELSIDSDGNVHLEGGWLNLRDQYAFSFYGFTFEVTQLGLGHSDDGGQWVGFSGGIKFVDGLSAGGSVEGLRLTWYEDARPPALTFNGVGVEFEIPGSIRFKGSVSFNELPGNVQRFDGDISLDLLAVGLELDAKLVIGTADNAAGERYSFFAIYLGVELPAGIPLWSTGLALYGIAGLVAINMAPNKGAPPNALHPGSREDEQWYENPDGSPGWYKRDVVGVTDLRSKWDPDDGAFAFGAGITLGTLPDNGLTFNGSLLLVMSFPGPIILIEGKANLLKERSKLGDDPTFRALAVLDFRGGTFLFGLDARYAYGDTGQLIDIRGNVEAFFDVNNPLNWHLYLGQKEPRSKRIKAELLSLWESNSYFMLDARRIQTGAWVGYDEDWRFGPLRLVLEAWLEGNVIVSWDPGYFHGDVWAHGKIELSVFGFGLGIGLDARIAADVFDPFHLLGEFSAGINLPWPLPNFSVTVTLEWGPEPGVPPFPMPTTEVAIEHFKVTSSWPLPRGQLLLPDYDSGGGYLADPPPASADALAPPANAPVVPLDARPHITFAHSIHDDAGVGVNPQPVSPPFERIGDPERDEGPMRVTFRLKEVTLDAWSGTSWSMIARKAADPNPVGIKELFGSWAPVPSLPNGQPAPGEDPATANTKLWLWSKTPFDYTRHGGRGWDEWFEDTFENYPCVPRAPDRWICCDFSGIQKPIILGRLQMWVLCEGLPGVTVSASPGTGIREFNPPRDGFSHGLCFRNFDQLPGQMVFDFSSQPASEIRLRLAKTAQPAERCVNVAPNVEQASIWFEAAGVDVSVKGGDPDLVEAGGLVGMNVGTHAKLGLPCHATAVSVRLASGSSEVTVRAIDDDGQAVASRKVEPGTAQTISLTGTGIAAVFIESPNNETVVSRFCFSCPDLPPVVLGIAWDANNGHLDTATPEGHLLVLKAPTQDAPITTVSIVGLSSFCIVEVCARVPADPAEVAARQDMAQHLQDSLARWSDTGEVLLPDTEYRIRVVTEMTAEGEGELSGLMQTRSVTEFSYFRTDGPPGLTALSPPINHPGDEPFLSGLETLARYVKQTIPATVSDAGDKPLLPRPVYCAYDTGVAFNEDYVDLLYRISGRDLALYLYDSNNEPVRDPAGRLVAAGNRWGHDEMGEISASSVRWIRRVDAATCTVFDQTIPLGRTLADETSRTLRPDTVYEVRVVPLLLRESFAEGIGDWQVVDQGTTDAPSIWQTTGHGPITGVGATSSGVDVSLNLAVDLSQVDTTSDFLILSSDTARPDKRYRIIAVNNPGNAVTLDGTPVLSGGTSGWEIPARHSAIQMSNIYGGSVDGSNPVKPGTMLIRGRPDWTDYRLSVTLRNADNDAIGVVFRYQDSHNYYRWSMDSQRSYRRLTRVRNGVHTVLYADGESYSQDTDYRISVEAMGADIRIYQDGDLVAAVNDGALSSGVVGLYLWASEGGQFSDVAVDDFSADAVAVYAYQFTTSGFANFVHHMHSYNDTAWQTVPDDPDISAERAQAASVSAAFEDPEARAFEAAATKVYGASALLVVDRAEVHRIDTSGGVVLGLRTPEPIDWSRFTLTLEKAPPTPVVPFAPDSVKILGISRSGGSANDEIVHILARRALDPTGWEVQRLQDGSSPLVFPVPILRDAIADAVDDLAILDPFSIPRLALPRRLALASQPVWVTHFRFEDERPFSAGSAIDIHSGSAGQPAPSRANVERRFVAPINAAGSVQFGADRAQLRLVDPTGRERHRQLFLPDTAFAPVTDLVVLRKRDGTGLFLLPGAGSSFGPGRYRLTLRFRRDNRASDPTTAVLSQAGDTQDEVAMLEVDL